MPFAGHGASGRAGVLGALAKLEMKFQLTLGLSKGGCGAAAMPVSHPKGSKDAGADCAILFLPAALKNGWAPLLLTTGGFWIMAGRGRARSATFCLPVLVGDSGGFGPTPEVFLFDEGEFEPLIAGFEGGDLGAFFLVLVLFAGFAVSSKVRSLGSSMEFSTVATGLGGSFFFPSRANAFFLGGACWSC